MLASEDSAELAGVLARAQVPACARCMHACMDGPLVCTLHACMNGPSVHLMGELLNPALLVLHAKVHDAAAAAAAPCVVLQRSSKERGQLVLMPPGL